MAAWGDGEPGREGAPLGPDGAFGDLAGLGEQAVAEVCRAPCPPGLSHPAADRCAAAGGPGREQGPQ